MNQEQASGPLVEPVDPFDLPDLNEPFHPYYLQKQCREGEHLRALGITFALIIGLIVMDILMQGLNAWVSRR